MKSVYQNDLELNSNFRCIVWPFLGTGVLVMMNCLSPLFGSLLSLNIKLRLAIQLAYFDEDESSQRRFL